MKNNIEPQDKNYELKEDKNLLLFFYRYWTGREDELPPSICPLTWLGVLGFITFITTPVIFLIILISWVSNKGKIPIIEIRANIGRESYKLFVYQFLIIIIYFILSYFGFIILGYNGSVDVEWYDWIYGWLIPTICIIIIISIAFLIDTSYRKIKTHFRDKKYSKGEHYSYQPKKQNILIKGFMDWYDRNCTRIDWK